MPKTQFPYLPFTMCEFSSFSLLIRSKVILTCLVLFDIWDPDFTTYFFFRDCTELSPYGRRTSPFLWRKWQGQKKSCPWSMHFLLHENTSSNICCSSNRKKINEIVSVFEGLMVVLQKPTDNYCGCVKCQRPVGTQGPKLSSEEQRKGSQRQWVHAG